MVAFLGLLMFFGWGPDSRLARFDSLSSIGGLVVAVASLVISARSLTLAVRAPATDPAVLLQEAVEDLAAQVLRQWQDELSVRGMGHLDPIRLRWSATGRPVMPSPAEVVGADRLPPAPVRVTRLRLAGDLDTVTRTLTRLPSRQLVVIGAPGAGKSTLAILLTLGLLARRRPTDAVPVLLTMTGWDPDREHLHSWLAGRLAQAYPALGSRGRYHPDTAVRLVDRGVVLPVLDGLDEIPEPVQAAALTALTAAVGRDRPLVLTSRAEQYQDAVRRAGAPLARAAVVEIEPVTAADAAAYLAAGQAEPVRWRPVLAHLTAAPDGALARTLRTPLMVHLARVAYQDPDSDPAGLLAFTDPETITSHLLHAYLPAVYTRPVPPPPHRGVSGRRTPRRYPLPQARQWLAFLAAHLTQQQTTDLAWWRLRDAVPSFRLALALIAGLVAGPVFGLVFGLTSGPRTGLIAGLTAGLSTALMYGLLVGSVGGRSAPQRTQVNIDQLAVGAMNVLAAGGLGLALGFGVGLVAGWRDALTGGLVLAVMFGLMTAVTYGTEVLLGAPVSLAQAVTPGSTLASDRRVSGVILVAVALMWGVPVGNEDGLVVGLAVGPAAGLLAAVSSAAWPAFVVARALLAVRGRTPYDLMRFLDDAHHRGVLRQTGAVYQFRHARLQQHLAMLHHAPPATQLTVPAGADHDPPPGPGRPESRNGSASPAGQKVQPT
ncbi:MAG TPA: NACHT domain-containing protein [Micromonosporaceae bacterium]|nr:NACHT domain-containing protein [Micromonosporaceae bacterium]